jgi:hypothetical protein
MARAPQAGPGEISVPAECCADQASKSSSVIPVSLGLPACRAGGCGGKSVLHCCSVATQSVCRYWGQETESRLGTLWDEEQCMQFCSKDELWEASKEEEMKIPWKEASEGQPVQEDQYQDRFCRLRLDGIGWVTETKEFLAIEFKQTQDTRSNYVERATAVAQEQYTSLLTGLQAVCQVKGWKVQQIVFVSGTCGSVHVESFNKNMKALGFLESKWDPIRKKLVRRLLEEQDKVLLSYFAQKGGVRSQGGKGIHGKGREHVKGDMFE